MDPSAVLASFVSTYGVPAIFLVMLLKETGVPVPVPSDLVMIAAGVQIASGAYSPVALLIALLLAVFLGGSMQFLIARTAGRAVVYRLAALVAIGPGSLDRAVIRLREGGPRAVFLGLNIPGARAAVIPAAGLARLPFVPFAAATLGGSIVFYGWHIALGYLIGPAAATLLDRYAVPLLAAFVVLAAAGLLIWLVLRRRARSGEPSGLGAWTEAACPACLAAAAIGRR